MSSHSELCDTIEAGMASLGADARAFAAPLVASVRARGVRGNDAFWLERLAAQAAIPPGRWRVVFPGSAS